MSIVLRRHIPMIMLAAVAVIVTISYIIINPILEAIASQLLSWAALLGAFGIIVGSIFTLRANYTNIIKKRPMWYWSVYVIALITLFIIIGLGEGITVNGPITSWFYEYVMSPAGTAIFGISAYYMISASYISIRARSIEGAILLITMVIVALNNTPFVSAYTYIFRDITNWILTYPNTGANRAFIICSSIGGVIIAIRTILGRERGGGISS